MLIREIKEEERPRERAVMHGVNKLSNSELLAVIIGTGSKKKSAIEVGGVLLKNIDKLNDLSEITLNELLKIDGIGKAKGLKILASLELGKRVNLIITTGKLKNPLSVYNFLKEEMHNLKQEIFVCIYLDSKSKVIAKKNIFKGSLNVSVVHPREVFKWGVKLSSASIILSHNHPSGDPIPSIEDIEVTKKLVEIGEIMGIHVIDHVIIGNEKYYSLKEEGYI